MNLLFFFLLSSSSIFGQDLGEIHGTVVDQNGEVMPFLHILVFSNNEDLSSMIARSETEVDGHFRIKCMEAGMYDLIIRNYNAEDFTIERIEVMENQINFMGELRIPYEIIGCDFGLPTPMMKETLDPFGRSITIKSEDIRMR